MVASRLSPEFRINNAEIRSFRSCCNNFGKIYGGSAFNVLAEKVNLVGTVRCTNLKLFKNIGHWLNKNISSLANSCGADAKVIFREITPPVNVILKLIEFLEIRDSGFGSRKCYRITKTIIRC